MPKMKTRKTAAKRLKQTGTGKFLRRKAGRRHLMSGKSAKRRRRLRKATLVGSADINRIKSALPYGLK
ncbi:MAG TPA: 50S ribosomal protein L35 [Victivallales bacterium]|nr:50S ribosomal protein L35 [Victivallales bacterium]HPO91096.1 50S ribosomal protein L35 [Victivallales bacterium]HRR29554.1 50S ribosomal protein L35 [Victivallales bacterium]HRU00813.1 50S ribosomal protein L35 [Victivallales bacterium]